MYHDNELACKVRRNVRQEVIEILGGYCVRCGFDDWRALQVDHVHGGGSAEYKKKGNMKVYREIIAADDFTGYQLLCANCNWIKRYKNKETKGEKIRVSEKA